MRIPFMRTLKIAIKEQQLKRELLKENWVFSPKRTQMILSETPDWQEHYLITDLKGKTVFDVGAGQGETARLFIKNGAKKVICCECDTENLFYLFKNAQIHKEIEVVPQAFLPYMLQIPHDFMKMDIEGFEEIIINENITLPNPSVLEIHGLQLKQKFERRNFRFVNHWGCDWWCCYGYYRC